MHRKLTELCFQSYENGEDKAAEKEGTPPFSFWTAASETGTNNAYPERRGSGTISGEVNLCRARQA
jgi:hypothetical protein